MLNYPDLVLKLCVHFWPRKLSENRKKQTSFDPLATKQSHCYGNCLLSSFTRYVELSTVSMYQQFVFLCLFYKISFFFENVNNSHTFVSLRFCQNCILPFYLISSLFSCTFSIRLNDMHTMYEWTKCLVMCFKYICVDRHSCNLDLYSCVFNCKIKKTWLFPSTSTRFVKSETWMIQFKSVFVSILISFAHLRVLCLNRQLNKQKKWF